MYGIVFYFFGGEGFVNDFCLRAFSVFFVEVTCLSFYIFFFLLLIKLTVFVFVNINLSVIIIKIFDVKIKFFFVEVDLILAQCERL